VSHDLGQVERIADHVVLLAAGRSEGEWGSGEFFSRAGEKARRFISGRS
jgi:ABC-type glutathione transport system ATPase component